MAIRVEVQQAAGRGEDIPSERSIAVWAKKALAGRKEDAQLVIRIVDEAEGRALNERYRERPGATNVLSFPFEGPDVLEPPLLGDIVICAPIAAREAREQNKPAVAHWAHLVVHGTLHLLGYDHENDHDAEIMESLEAEILGSLGYPDPYDAARPVPTSRPPSAVRSRGAGR